MSHDDQFTTENEPHVTPDGEPSRLTPVPVPAPPEPTPSDAALTPDDDAPVTDPVLPPATFKPRGDLA